MIEYWFVFPVAVLISTIAMMFGIGGAVMFMPFFSLVLALPASLAAGAGLFIEFFGFSSGVVGFSRKKLINYQLARRIISISAPLAVLGVISAQHISDTLLLLLLATVLIILATVLLREHAPLHNNHNCKFPNQTTGETRSWRSALFPATGGFMAGATGSGLGEITDYLLIKNEKMSGAAAAGTSVFVVAVTAFVGVMAHAYTLIGHPEILPQVLSILLFAVPGVLIGAQIGVHLSQKVSDTNRPRYTAALFFGLAILIVISIIV